MADDNGALYLKDAIQQLRAYKKLGEKAIAQVYDSGLTQVLYADANSIAILVKHLSGNMRSRWTMFLTTDGEKPDRNRDAEFEMPKDPTREELLTWWDDGWARVFDAVGAPQARRPGADGHDSRPAAHRAPGDQPAIDALLLPHRADRAAGASARRRQLEVAQYPEAAIAELSSPR